MPQADNEIRVVPSVLDRLRDEQPEVSSEPARARAKSLGEIKQLVREDLQALFNTRQGLPTSPGGGAAGLGAELQNSLLTYGLPDFCAASVVSTLDQNRIRRALEVAIERFEPRLRDVRVSLLPSRATERALHFRIDANLRVEPAPEPVSFDTVLHIASGEYQIQAR